MAIDIATHERLARELLSSHYLLIGEERVTRTDSDRFAHVNPATGKVQADVVMAGIEEVDRAVAERGGGAEGLVVLAPRRAA